MPASEQLKALVSQLPDPDQRGMLSNINKEKVEAVIAQIHEGGTENVLGLIDMLVEPGKGDDVKPHYALHVLAVHVCKLQDEKARAEFAKAVASQIPKKPRGVATYLIEQLQVAGGPEVVPDLGKALLDPALCDYACRALEAIGDGATEQLLAALPKVKGKSRLHVVNSLGALAQPQAAPALRGCLKDGDAEIRASAAWGLARIADEAAAEPMLQLADSKQGWERIRETEACLLLAENLAKAGKKDKARAIYTHLRQSRNDPSEAYVREAAERGLATL